MDQNKWAELHSLARKLGYESIEEMEREARDEARRRSEVPAEEPEPEPKLDAMALSGADVSALTTAMLGGPVIIGGAPMKFTEKPQRQVLAPQVQVRIDAAEEKWKRANEERAKALQAGAIDARTAGALDMRRRVTEIGIDAHTGIMFQQPTPPAPADAKAKDPEAARRQAQSKAEAKVRALIKSGDPFSARDLSAEEWAAYLRLRRMQPASAVAAHGLTTGE